MKTTVTGFLIVLKTPERRGEQGMRLNPRYSGVDRVPVYPSNHAEEVFALDEYVFGDIKSDKTNLIPDLAAALKLWDNFLSSPRVFEVIMCCSGPNDAVFKTLKSDEVVALGYDVAGVTGDGWSIVGDFASSEWAKAFLNCLNEYGLFRDRSYAEDYLRGYRENNEPDADWPFEIVYVARVETQRLIPLSQ